MKKKQCLRCPYKLPLSAFGTDRKRPDGKNVYCKSCKSIMTSAVYRRNLIENREKGLIKRKQFASRNREHVRSFLQQSSCVDCGDTRWEVLEFDHVRGEKKCGIADLIWQGGSIAKLQEEMNKCETRCANCHRLKTASQLAWAKSESTA